MLTRAAHPIRSRLWDRQIAFVAGLGIALAASLANADGPLETTDGAIAAPKRPYAITEERDPCAEFTPERSPFFGDLHVHTARSQDASTQDTRISPREAYRFARGERLGIQPFDDQGNALRQVQLDRPLDFAAITDHAEQIGEVHICTTPTATGYDSMVCRLYRNFPRVAFFVMNGRYSLFESRWGFCGDDAEICLAASRVVWSEHQQAAEEAYDRSAQCDFTSLVAYEWTASGSSAGGHLHRNVIFRNKSVPDLPISVMETSAMAINLWKQLDEKCRDGKPDCEVITIPHNSNWSAGAAFTSAKIPNAEITAEEAPLRARYDRLVEMVQHKGESECALYPGTNDEGCGFEKAPNSMVSTGDDFAPINFARDALKRGLALESTLGVNPLAFGQIGSTDTHLGTPGLVKERGFPGHGGAGKPGNSLSDDPGFSDLVSLNPGGLAVLWAEETNRYSLFEAMNRKETYATSGTRPSLRFFGGWNYPTEEAAAETRLCNSNQIAAAGYAGGVPMGGDLPARPPGAGAPRFLIAASRDPHPNGANLERIEIIKGYLEDGEQKEVVLTVADAPTTASVDLKTCERSEGGARQLCTVWEDPDFDADQPAFYYTRIRENESCRWTQWACLDAGIQCDDLSTMSPGMEACCTEDFERTIQERAWSSPIWYRPRLAN